MILWRVVVHGGCRVGRLRVWTDQFPETRFRMKVREAAGVSRVRFVCVGHEGASEILEGHRFRGHQPDGLPADAHTKGTSMNNPSLGPPATSREQTTEQTRARRRRRTATAHMLRGACYGIGTGTVGLIFVLLQRVL